MKAFTRIAAALGLVAVFGTTAVFAQAPTISPMKTHVKGYTKTLKSGKMVKVKGYNRMAGKPAMKPMTHVKGYTKTLKSGKTVQVKGYNRKPMMKPMMGKPMMKKPGGTM